MALVSRTTFEKREIRDLLNHVHSHADPNAPLLEDKPRDGSQSPRSGGSDALPTEFPPGVGALGQFTGFTRCVLPIRDAASADVTQTSVWVSEQDGRIRIRNAGKCAYTSKAPEDAIPPVPQAFVTAMVQVGAGDVWCGYSDGYVRVYSIATRQKIFERKRHVSAVTCIAAYNDYVFSGGEDFKILVWSGTTKNMITSFLGHKNHVRSLLVHHGRLYSAGADGTVRCWSIRDESEVISAPFPLTVTMPSPAAAVSSKSGGNGHHGSSHTIPADISSIAIRDDYLFVACPMKVALFKLDSGKLAHTVPLGNLLRDGVRIVTVAVCDATATMWISLSDGAVRVYDLFNYEHTGVIEDHSKTVVTAITPVSRTTVNRIFILTEDGLTSLTASSDCLVPKYEPFQGPYQQSHDQVNERRDKLSQNAAMLTLRKAQLRALRRYDEVQRKSAAVAMANRQQRLLTETFSHQQLDFVVLRRNLARQATLEKALADHDAARAELSELGEKDGAASRVVADRLKRGMLSLVTANMSRSTKLRFAGAAIEALRRRRNAEIRSEAAEHLRRRARTVLASTAWRRWSTFAANRRGGAAVKAAVLGSVSRVTKSTSQSRVWTTMVVGAENLRLRRMLTAAAQAFLACAGRRAAQLAFRRWLAGMRQRKLAKRRTILADRLGRHSDANVRRNVLLLFAVHARSAATKRQQAATAELNARVEEIDKILSDPELLSEEELDKQITSLTAQVDAAEQNVALLRKQVEDADRLVERLEAGTAVMRLPQPTQDGSNSSNKADAVSWLMVRLQTQNILRPVEDRKLIQTLTGKAPEAPAAAAGGKTPSPAKPGAKPGTAASPAKSTTSAASPAKKTTSTDAAATTSPVKRTASATAAKPAAATTTRSASSAKPAAKKAEAPAAKPAAKRSTTPAAKGGATKAPAAAKSDVSTPAKAAAPAGSSRTTDPVAALSANILQLVMPWGSLTAAPQPAAAAGAVEAEQDKQPSGLATQPTNEPDDGEDAPGANASVATAKPFADDDAPAQSAQAAWNAVSSNPPKQQSEATKIRMAATIAAARSALIHYGMAQQDALDVAGVDDNIFAVASQYAWLREVLAQQLELEADAATRGEGGATSSGAPKKAAPKKTVGAKKTAAAPAPKAASKTLVPAKADQQTRTGVGESDKARSKSPAPKRATAKSPAATTARPAAKPAAKPASRSASKQKPAAAATGSEAPAPKPAAKRTASAATKPAAKPAAKPASRTASPAAKPAAKRSASSTGNKPATA